MSLLTPPTDTLHDEVNALHDTHSSVMDQVEEAMALARQEEVEELANSDFTLPEEDEESELPDGAAFTDQDPEPNATPNINSLQVPESNEDEVMVRASSSHGITASSSALSPVTSLSTSPPAPVATSSIDLIDYKSCEEKDGSTYITFLFELKYAYPPTTLLQALRLGIELPPTITMVVAKRFAELHSFHSLLSRHFVCLPQFAFKTLTRRTDKEFLEQRCAILQSYMRLLLIREDVQRTGWMQKFLGIPTPGARIREAVKEAKLKGGQKNRTASNAAPAASSSLRKASSVAPAAASSTQAASTSSRYDSALGGDPDQHGGSVEIIAPSTPSQPRALEQLDDGDEEGPSSEPATSSNSFVGGLLDTDQQDGYNSDHEYESAMILSMESPLSHMPGKVHDGSSITGRKNEMFQQQQTEKDNESLSATAASLAAIPTIPCSSTLTFLSRSPVFHMLRFLSISNGETLLAIASDRTIVAKVDNWLSGLFGSVMNQTKKPVTSQTNFVEEDATQLHQDTTYTTGSSLNIVNPLGAFYVFRKRSEQEMEIATQAAQIDAEEAAQAAAADAAANPTPFSSFTTTTFTSSQFYIPPSAFTQTLVIPFTHELTTLDWDAAHHSVFLGDSKGHVTCFRLSEQWTSAEKTSTAKVFPDSFVTAGTSSTSSLSLSSLFSSSSKQKEQQQLNQQHLQQADLPVTHTTLYTPTSYPGGLLICITSKEEKRQYLSIYDIANQRLLPKSTLLFTSGSASSSNPAASVGCITAATVCPITQRLFLSAGRVISIYDLSCIDRSPPQLLHRLAGGHQDSNITCLAFNPLTQCLASGGEDKYIVLWMISPKGAEKSTKLYAQLQGHESRLSSVSWSEDAMKQYVVSGDDSGHLCLWTPVKRACLLAFRAHADKIMSVQVTDDLSQHHALTLMTASADKAAKSWCIR